MDETKSCLLCDKIELGHYDEFRGMGVYHFEPLKPAYPGHRIFMSREHHETPRLSSGIVGLVMNAIEGWAQENEETFDIILSSGPTPQSMANHLHIHYFPKRDDVTPVWEQWQMIERADVDRTNKSFEDASKLVIRVDPYEQADRLILQATPEHYLKDILNNQEGS